MANMTGNPTYFGGFAQNPPKISELDTRIANALMGRWELRNRRMQNDTTGRRGTLRKVTER